MNIETDYGAVGDGIADDTVPFLNASIALAGTGQVVYCPRKYRITQPIPVSGAMGFIGESRYGSGIVWNSLAQDVFQIASNGEVVFEKLKFDGPTGATSGAIVRLTGSSAQNLFTSFRDCRFSRGYSHIVTESAADWSLDNCVLSNYQGYGVYVGNVYSPDAGDSFIGGSTFSTTSTTATGIHQVSSGGLKVDGNKVLGGAYGYRLALSDATSSTIDLILSNNSVENQAIANVSFDRLSGSLSFGNVVINGNQMSNSPVAIASDSNVGWLKRMAICGNQITLPAIDGTGMSLGAPSSFIISGNETYGQSGNSIGVIIGSAASNGKIGPNGYHNLAHKLINNSSSVFVADSATQTGTATVSCATPYASLFLGLVNVTFPTPFDFVPVVNCAPIGVSGGVSAWPSSITKTGFILVATSVTNGGSGVCSWSAQGFM